MFPEQQISILDMIYESCDTENWINSALITGINYILKYIQIENSFFLNAKHFTILLFFNIIKNT